MLEKLLADVDPEVARAADQQAEQAGLIRLAAIARKRRDELFDKIRERYLDGRADSFLVEIDRVADDLADRDVNRAPRQSGEEQQ